MKICIDARSPGYAGIFNYTRRLLPALRAAGPEHELVVLRTVADKPWNVPGVEEYVIPSANPLRWMVWSNTRLPALLRSEGFDVYHSHKHITALRRGTPKVISFHGARVFLQPETYRWPEYAYWRTMTPIAARRYDSLLVASEVDKENFVKHMRVDPAKFSVVPLGVDEQFAPITDRAALDAVRARYSLPERFLLFVGRMLPVKNLETILRAFATAAGRGIPHDLVLVGQQTAHAESLRTLAHELGIADRLQWTGPVQEGLPEVMNLADLLLLASTYESFAFVALEAMACGTPVIASDRGNLPALVGDAGWNVPAFDTNAFAEAILEATASDSEREERARRGIERAAGYSWESCARGTLDVLERVGGSAS